MFVIEELIRTESNGALSFGNHLSQAKLKAGDFEVKGDIYNLKTYNEVTRLEKNENLLFEAVPGATVHNFKMSEEETGFTLYGAEDTQVIVELEPSSEYDVKVGSADLGSVKTTMAGKLIFSTELSDKPVKVIIKKANG